MASQQSTKEDPKNKKPNRFTCPICKKTANPHPNTTSHDGSAQCHVCKLHWHYTCIDDLKKGEREWIENGKMFNKTNYWTCRTCEGALEQVKNRVDEHDVKIEILSRKNDELSEELEAQKAANLERDEKLAEMKKAISELNIKMERKAATEVSEASASDNVIKEINLRKSKELNLDAYRNKVEKAKGAGRYSTSKERCEALCSGLRGRGANGGGITQEERNSFLSSDKKQDEAIEADLYKLKNFKIIFSNVRSIVNKFNELASLVSIEKPDIIALTETFLRPDLPDSLFALEGYQIINRLDGSDTHAGIARGLIIYCKEELQATKYENKAFTGVNQIGGIQFCSDTKLKINTTLVLVYRPPRSPFSVEDGNNTAKLCSAIASLPKNVLILGDFNFPTITWDRLYSPNAGEKVFIDLVKDKFLHQLVDFPTHS